MTGKIAFDPVRLPAEAEALRIEVRDFLRDEIQAGNYRPHVGDGFDRAFSCKVGAKGWIGMTWPKKYGGQQRSHLERYVVTEEFLVAGAPTKAHFTADRQSGPVLLKYASESLKRTILPSITRGECSFAIGMPILVRICLLLRQEQINVTKAGVLTDAKFGPALRIMLTI